jgi:hypothetical protein
MVIVLVKIKKIYVRIPKNRMFLTIIKNIFIDKKAISLIIIVLKKNIIVNWFIKNITSHKQIIVSNSNYTNKEICII